jgi:hypothetical protein
MTFSIKKCSILFLVLFSSINSFAQDYTLQNEELIFSFATKNAKQGTLSKDKANGYIIYRFGTKDKVEFEYPTKTKSSFSAFTYSFLMRGGGTQNEGVDLNYVYFTNKGFKYVIYDTYYATGNKKEIGIKIINLITNKTTNIKGAIKTPKGTLVDFRDNNLLMIGEEIFD